MEYKEIKEKALKEKEPKKLLKIIEDNHLQNDKEIINHFNNIDNDSAWNNNYYIRKK